MQIALGALCTIMLLLAPIAGASSRVESPLVVLVVEDARGDSCNLAVGPACQADAHPDTSNPGDTTADVDQHVYYVGVAPGTPIPLVPRDETRVRAQEVVVPNPVVPALTDAWNAHEPDLSAVTNWTVSMSSEKAAVHYYAPAPNNPAGPPGRRETNLTYSTDQGIHYDSIGPVSWSPMYADTDGRWNGTDRLVCTFAGSILPECYERIAQAQSAYEEATPNVQFGAGWQELQAATDPDDLRPSAASPSSHASAASTTRSHAQDSIPRAPQRAQPEIPPERDGPPAEGPAPPEPPWERAEAATRTSHLALMASASAKDALSVVAVAGAAAVLALLAVLAYSRFRPRDALRHERRRLVFEAIQANPGINVLSLARLLNFDRGDIRYHVRMLRQTSLIREVHAFNEVQLYPTGAMQPEPLEVPEARNEIVRALENAPTGLTRRELHEAVTNIPKRTRNHVIRRLLQAGAIHEAVSNGTRVFRLGRDPRAT